MWLAAARAPLAVVPPIATITAAYSNACSTGFRVDYYIYGGNPPYTVAASFPAGVTLVNSTVARSGDFFEAITNGACVDPLVFTIADSAGKQTTASLINKPGTATPPGPPVAPAFSVVPDTVAVPGCAGKTVTFLLTGGTPPYNAVVTSYASAAAPTISPNVIASDGGTFAVTFAATPPVAGPTLISVGDSSTPRKSGTATISCN